jgi:ABC-2 type transport system ATP-binding protein
MNAVIATSGLGKAYRRTWALRDCTLAIPEGHVVLVASRVRVAGEVSDLLASHHRLSGPRRDLGSLPAGQEVITESHTDKQSNLLVRTDGPVLDPAWAVKPVSLEDLVLAYMSQAAAPGHRRRHLEVQK